ncbi:MAG: hypothetical protein P4M04_04615 [Acidobacteriota bacterium]|nr:hypothetical protein [Acidobacteriota bacterium]
MGNSQATTHDAELILRLYDLRREPLMREARSFIFNFMPQTIDDVMVIVSDFSLKENAFFRQVVGYWDMAASLVLRGALNEDLARDNFQELIFVYSRLQPFLAEVRKRTGMERLAAHMQKFVESSPEAQMSMKRFQERFAEQAQAVAKGA